MVICLYVHSLQTFRVRRESESHSEISKAKLDMARKSNLFVYDQAGHRYYGPGMLQEGRIIDGQRDC